MTEILFLLKIYDSVPSSKTNIFQSKLYTLIYCRHFRTYSRCAMLIEVIWSSDEKINRSYSFQAIFYISIKVLISFA
jgi:hypothetical protein